jgi:uncharacterized phage infection (PIP) family protein YhgE
MSFSVNLMRRLDILEPPLKEILWTILDEIEQHREASVTKTEFNELKEIVRELGQTTKALVKALDRTEQRLAEVQARTEQRLAEAQVRTEQRLVEMQARTDQSLTNLAEAQARTDQSLTNLAEAQARTDQSLTNLTEAQARTDQSLTKLTEAQNRTDQRLASLAQTQEELAQAQKGVMKAIGELTQAQQQTEQKVTKLSDSIEELTQVQKRTEQEVAELSRSLQGTRSQVGGLARSMSYALENDAYCQLPTYLKTHYQIEITEQFIRTMIGGEEINLFAKAVRNTEIILVVGETVLRLDDRAKMRQLEKNVQVVAAQFHQPVFPLIITHFAHPTMLEQAREAGVLVVQSFEWNRAVNGI